MFLFASYQHLFFSIQRLLSLATCVFFLGKSTPAVAAPLATSGHRDSQLATSSLSSKAKIPRLAFVSPTFGESETGSSVTIELKLSSDASKLEVKLNGHDVSAVMGSSSCRGQTCTMTGTVGVQEGLKNGENLLWASVSVPGAGGEVKRITFSYQDKLGSGAGGNTIEPYEPVSVGISTVAPGGAAPGSPWIQITTGVPMGVSDPIASLSLPTKTDPVSIPYADKQFSTDCTSNLQAIVLDRTTPSIEETTACADNVTDLKNSLDASLKSAPNHPLGLGSSDLVILGTTSGTSAPAGLDTTAFGGTDYSNTPSNGYPQEYMLIGVSGASAGTAHESFDVVAPTGTNQDPAFLNGTLMMGLDGDGYYNYLPSDDRLLSVSSGADAASTSITIGRQTYTAPASSGGGGFWLLVLDRQKLQPVNYPSHGADGAPWVQCMPNVRKQTPCGGMFPISAGPLVASDLETTLASINPRNLVFLVAAGCSFLHASTTAAELGSSVSLLGGVAPSLMNLNTDTNTCAYSLVSVNDGKHMDVLTGKAAFSANQYSAQGQSGAIQGFVARDRSGLYDVAGKAQVSMDANGDVISVDYNFEKAAASQRIDWPLTTAGQLAAYHDISFQLLNAIGSTGTYDYDIRHFYNQTGVMSLLFPLAVSLPPAKSPLMKLKKSIWDTAATTDDFMIAQNQLALELQQLASATNYLTATGGIRDILGTSGTGIFANMFGVASDISSDQAHADSFKVNGNFSNEANLAAGVLSIAAVVGGAAVPPLGIVLGIMSGALWAGSAAGATEGGNIPGPENYFDVTLTQLASDDTTYFNNLQYGFDGAVNNIFSDAKKLETVSGYTSDSDSGWDVAALRTEELNTLLVSGAARSLWMDVLPSLYAVRVIPQWTSPKPATFGSYTIIQDPANGPMKKCLAVYGEVPNASILAYSLGINSNFFAIDILGEGTRIKHNFSNDVEETPISSDLAQFLMSPTSPYSDQTALNIPPDILFSNGPLLAIPPAQYGHNTCVPGNDLGGAEGTSFTITGPDTGVVGQRAGTYVITATGQDGKLNRKFDGKVAVELTGPGNTDSRTNVLFHGQPENVDFRAMYPKQGVYTLKVTSGSLDATKQITVESVEVEEHASQRR
jgi:hypothetical protein